MPIFTRRRFINKYLYRPRPVEETSFTMTADAGSFTLSGQDALFNTAQVSAVGIYTETGQAVLFISTITAAQASYSL